MKLIPSNQTDSQTRFSCLMNSWVAVEESFVPLTRESKPVALRRSNGRRKSGRPTKYWLYGTGQIDAPLFQAYTDEEAIDQANEYLASIPSP